MAQEYKFFNSGVNDPRHYKASDFADYFGSVLSSGLLHTDNVPGMSVVVDAGTLNTIVAPGKAIMKGHMYENTTPLKLTHSIPEATMDRIDRIVLRLDLRNSERSILLHVKEGLPDAVPIVPDLQRDNFIYEISLGQIRVRANTVQLLASDIVDERLDLDVCGIVHSLISIPTDQLQLFIDARRRELGVEADKASAQLKEDMILWEKQWSDWFGGIQGQTFVTGAELTEHKNKKATDLEAAHVTLTADVNSKIAGEAISPIGVRRAIERSAVIKIRSKKDSNGTFTTVEYRSKFDNLLIAKSVLSGGSSPRYSTKTVTYYEDDGSTVAGADIFTLTYDTDGDLVSEV